eukprot:GHUV01028979.1.p1 GENE.GHUV01028979.1~~GHUV01028979.1.p1  ORF type:complete len:313 (+),score=89.64 GHUV01028979.1:62-1000(+)
MLPQSGRSAATGRCVASATSIPAINSPTVYSKPPKMLFEAVTAERGFLPAVDPLVRLPSSLSVFEDALREVPKLAVGNPGTLRSALTALPEFDLQQLSSMQQQQHVFDTLPEPSMCYSRKQQRALFSTDGSNSGNDPSNDAELWRAYMVLSFLAHAYLWCDGPDVPQTLPAVIAKPWAHVSVAIGMPPVLVYATYNLMNWKRLDPTKPLELGNIACQHNFLGGMDEEWFRLIHVAIEAAAAPAVAAIQPLQQAAQHVRDLPTHYEHGNVLPVCCLCTAEGLFHGAIEAAAAAPAVAAIQPLQLAAEQVKNAV